MRTLRVSTLTTFVAAALLSVALGGCHIFDRHRPSGHLARVDPAQYPEDYPDQTTNEWRESANMMYQSDGLTFTAREPGEVHHVWLHYGCAVNAPDPSGFGLSGTVGVRMGGQTQGPVPVTITQEGATLTGLTRSSSDAFVINSDPAEGERPANIDGYVYLFDVVPANGAPVDIIGSLSATAPTQCHGAEGSAILELWVD